MNQISKLRSAVALVIPLLFLSFVLFTACEKETRTITELVHDTTVVTQTDTIVVNIISVDSVYANPDSIAQGDTVTLTVDVSTLPGAGTNLSYDWVAEAGQLTSTTNDTVTWKAPAEIGAYRINVHVTDGEHIAIGNRIIGVGMYAPTETPYYVGEETCGTCHASRHTDWEGTGHAEAWAGLMTSSHAGPSCFPCHTVGYDGPTGNSGFDEVPIAKFQNVQCENCHSAGSEHPATRVDLSFDEIVCGDCHQGEHHPYLSEWQQSPHNYDPAVSAHGAPENGGCQGCHEGFAAAKRLAGDLSTFYDGEPYGSPARDTTVYEGFMNTYDNISNPNRPIVCQTCHDPHSADNPGQLRTVDDVVLVTANNESPVIAEGGAGKLCMQCHHARRAAEDQIPSGYAYFGPHPNPQADMVSSKSGYQGVADANFVWAGPTHLYIENSCVTCHVHQHTGSEENKTGHLFEPSVEACAECHGTITSFDEIMATSDFDGDGSIEGIQSEVTGLLDLLAVKLYEADTLNQYMGTDPNLTPETALDSLSATVGDTSALAVKLRKGGYNLAFVLDDKSEGVHNPDYAIQLLQRSVLFLDPNALPQNVLLKDDNATNFIALARASFR